MAGEQQYVIFWFRRDLRFADNKGLFHALADNENVIPLFIFDTEIINHLPKNDARIEFIHLQLSLMDKKLKSIQRGMWIYKGNPVKVFDELLENFNIKAVYTNKDHEPYGIERDEKIKIMLNAKGIGFYSHLDHLLFDKNAILKDDNTPYQVFTPYANKCRKIIAGRHLQFYNSANLLYRFTERESPFFPSLQELGFMPSGKRFPPNIIIEQVIKKYNQTRDFPALEATSQLGVHLRFGTISLRSLAKIALENNDMFFNELLWREFFAVILWHYPSVVNKSFKPQYDKIAWVNDQQLFEKWTEGKTGYPIVDAGMRQLSESGYMHNRVRMITASFLTKHLLTDWRWGEAWFAEKLIDFELSSNNGNWQWAAGSGCDAAPYFRIFNPLEQQRRFDPHYEYIKKYIPDFKSGNYINPIIDHRQARERCLKTFKIALIN